MGTEVASDELQRQLKRSGISYVVLIPFPSTAIANNDINVKLLEETKRIKSFLPYHYIRENYNVDGFDPIPDEYYGGKWHWMRGWQDSASNYQVLDGPRAPWADRKVAKTK